MKKKNMVGIIVLVLCLVVFTILLILPPKADAAVKHMPGWKTGGPFGDTCECPHLDDFNCGCAIVEQ